MIGATMTGITEKKQKNNLAYQRKERRDMPVLILLALATLSCCYAAKMAVAAAKYGKAFVFSCINLLFPILAYNVLLFPNLLVSSVDNRYTLTIFNSAAEPGALQHLIKIVLIALPFVIAYTIYIYRVFRGKTDFPSIY